MKDFFGILAVEKNHRMAGVRYKRGKRRRRWRREALEALGTLEALEVLDLLHLMPHCLTLPTSCDFAFLSPHHIFQLDLVFMVLGYLMLFASCYAA